MEHILKLLGVFAYTSAPLGIEGWPNFHNQVEGKESEGGEE